MPKASEIFNLRKTLLEDYPEIDSDYNDFPKPIDFIYESTFYGRVDARQNSIYISLSEGNNRLRFKQIHPEKQIFALNFVADAFFSFQRHVSTANAAGKLHTVGSIIVDMIPEKGFSDIDSAWAEHKQTIADIITDSFLALPQHNDDVESFSDFLQKFVEF